MEYTYRGKTFSVDRYPESGNRSLRPWSAADEYILRYLDEEEITFEEDDLMILNDRFGFLSCALWQFRPAVLTSHYSQHYSISSNIRNLESDSFPDLNFPLDILSGLSRVAVMRIPKSMEMFRFYIQKIADFSDDNVMVVCGFMTKYFTPKMLEIAEEFFETVEQSLGWKKSRLLILKNKKPFQPIELLNKIEFKEHSLQQYLGVFSSKHIDYATQFLIEHIRLCEEDESILDLASGNGVLGYMIRQKKPTAKIHFMDDSFLAAYSSMKNVSDENSFHICKNDLSNYEAGQFDFIISNPPFHNENEIDISIPIALFQQVPHYLKEGGHFQLVANQHLNYKTHLDKIFPHVDITAENDKFIIYDCWK